MKILKLESIVLIVAFYSQVALAADLSVSVSAPTVDIKKDCQITYSATVSGGCEPYTYAWSSSTGSCCTWTSSSITPTATTLGAGTMTVTVTDSQGATKTASKNYNVHNEVETTGPTSGGTTKLGAGKFVSNSLNCPSDSPGNCSLAYITTTTHSFAYGLTVTGGVDYGVTKVSVAGTATNTNTTASGETHTFLVAPGQVKAVFVRPRYVERTGTCKQYGCDGLISSGTWTNTEPASSAWEYTVVTPS